jgi:hypothetical protein
MRRIDEQVRVGRGLNTFSLVNRQTPKMNEGKRKEKNSIQTNQENS